MHRAHLLERLGTRSIAKAIGLAALARLASPAVAAGKENGEGKVSQILNGDPSVIVGFSPEDGRPQGDGPGADPGTFSALEMTFFGALVQAGSGQSTYREIADRLTDVISRILNGAARAAQLNRDSQR